MILKTTLLLFFCFCDFIVLSQEFVKCDTFIMLSVTNDDLLPILDSVIYFEKKCDYYNDSLFFMIDIVKVKDIYEIQISSSNSNNVAEEYWKSIRGFLYYKRHLFFIYGKASEDFFKIRKEKIILYREYDMFYSEKELLPIIDDSHTYWNYYFKDNRFLFMGKSSPCL